MMLSFFFSSLLHTVCRVNERSGLKMWGITLNFRVQLCKMLCIYVVYCAQLYCYTKENTITPPHCLSPSEPFSFYLEQRASQFSQRL